jgi:hypothetical protein
MKLNNSDPDIQYEWEQLQKILLNPSKKDEKIIKDLETLGYVIKGDTHPKMYITYKNKNYVITLQRTSSDCNWGRQTLRRIRRIYEE